MSGPAWLAALLAAVMLLLAAGSVVRLALWRLRGRAAEPEADIVHGLMGVAMAGMLEPRISPFPDTAWLLVFTAGAAWFACRAIRVRGQKHAAGGRQPRMGGWRCAHPAPHSVECAAMVYMLVPARGAGQRLAMAMPGMSGASVAANPAVALVLALFMLAYIVWMADRMTSYYRARIPAVALRQAGGTVPEAEQAADAPPPAGRAQVPQAACSKIAMSLAMGYMLLTML